MQEIITKTIDYVKLCLKNAEAGHDWFHIERVYKNALQINSKEKANELIVSLAALLHDIADPKFHDGDELLGPQLAYEFLTKEGVSPSAIDQVILIIKHMSFKNSFEEKTFHSPELAVVQDADRLDAIGAIGIARAFTYGGFKSRVLYDPEIPPVNQHNKESYKNTTAPTINHFYEKLLLLKDMMNTVTGKKMAQERHDFMLLYLDHFYKEWNSIKT